MGKVERIWLKRVKRGPMDSVSTAALVQGRGLEGNANQGGRRQVTLLSQEVWQQLTDALGIELDPSTRRANILVSGIDLAHSRGRVLKLGSARVRVFGETKPCRQMEEAAPGLQKLMRPDWRGGAFGEVLDSGELSVGDVVSWQDDDGADYL